MGIRNQKNKFWGLAGLLFVGMGVATSAHALSCERLGQSESVLGTVRWQFRGRVLWRNRSEEQRQLQVREAAFRQAVQRRNAFAEQPSKEEMEASLQLLLNEMNYWADRHNENLVHFPDNFVVALSWQTYLQAGERYHSYTRKWRRAPTTIERTAGIGDYDRYIRYEGKALSQARASLLRDSLEARSGELQNIRVSEKAADGFCVTFQDRDGASYVWWAAAENPEPLLP